MPVDVRWIIKERLILVRSWNIISIEEIAYASTLIREKLDECHGMAHVVWDEEHVFIENLPTDMKVLTRAFNFLAHANIGWILVTTHPRESIMDIVEAFLSKHFTVYYQRCASIDAAMKFLQEHYDIPEWDEVPTAGEAS